MDLAFVDAIAARRTRPNVYLFQNQRDRTLPRRRDGAGAGQCPGRWSPRRATSTRTASRTSSSRPAAFQLRDEPRRQGLRGRPGAAVGATPRRRSSSTTTTTASSTCWSRGAEGLRLFRNIGEAVQPKSRRRRSPEAPSAYVADRRPRRRRRRRHRRPGQAGVAAHPAQRRRQPQPLAARAAPGLREQPQRRRRQGGHARGQPAPEDRDVVRLPAAAARRRHLRARPACRRRRGPGDLAVGDHAGRGAGAEGGGDEDRGARPQAIVLSLSLRLGRRALRLHHRLHGRRRDGVPLPERRFQHARSRRVRTARRRSSCGRATAATSCGSRTSWKNCSTWTGCGSSPSITPRRSRYIRTKAWCRSRPRIGCSPRRRRARCARRSTTPARDVAADIAQLDDRSPAGFGLSRVRGYAADHSLTLDLGGGPGRPACCSPAGPTMPFRATTSPRARPASRCTRPACRCATPPARGRR